MTYLKIEITHDKYCNTCVPVKFDSFVIKRTISNLASPAPQSFIFLIIVGLVNNFKNGFRLMH